MENFDCLHSRLRAPYTTRIARGAENCELEVVGHTRLSTTESVYPRSFLCCLLCSSCGVWGVQAGCAAKMTLLKISPRHPQRKPLHGRSYSWLSLCRAAYVAYSPFLSCRKAIVLSQIPTSRCPSSRSEGSINTGTRNRGCHTFRQSQDGMTTDAGCHE